MVVIYVLLLIAAAVCFAVAAAGVNVGSARRSYNMVAVGLLLWVLVPLIHALITVS